MCPLCWEDDCDGHPCPDCDAQLEGAGWTCPNGHS